MKTWNILQCQHFFSCVIPVHKLKWTEIMRSIRIYQRYSSLYNSSPQRNIVISSKSLSEAIWKILAGTYRHSDPLYVSKISAKFISILPFINVVNFLIQSPAISMSTQVILQVTRAQHWKHTNRKSSTLPKGKNSLVTNYLLSTFFIYPHPVPWCTTKRLTILEVLRNQF